MVFLLLQIASTNHFINERRFHEMNFTLTWNQRCFLMSWTPSFWYPILSTGFSLQNLFISVTAVLKLSHLDFLFPYSWNIWHSCWNWISLCKVLLSLSDMSHQWQWLSFHGWVDVTACVIEWHDKEEEELNFVCNWSFFLWNFRKLCNSHFSRKCFAK